MQCQEWFQLFRGGERPSRRANSASIASGDRGSSAGLSSAFSPAGRSVLPCAAGAAGAVGVFAVAAGLPSGRSNDRSGRSTFETGVETGAAAFSTTGSGCPCFGVAGTSGFAVSAGAGSLAGAGRDEVGRKPARSRRRDASELIARGDGVSAAGAAVDGLAAGCGAAGFAGWEADACDGGLRSASCNCRSMSFSTRGSTVCRAGCALAAGGAAAGVASVGAPPDDWGEAGWGVAWGLDGAWGAGWKRWGAAGWPGWVDVGAGPKPGRPAGWVWARAATGAAGPLAGGRTPGGGLNPGATGRAAGATGRAAGGLAGVGVGEPAGR